jgi:hypothetical protein
LRICISTFFYIFLCFMQSRPWMACGDSGAPVFVVPLVEVEVRQGLENVTTQLLLMMVKSVQELTVRHKPVTPIHAVRCVCVCVRACVRACV